MQPQRRNNNPKDVLGGHVNNTQTTPYLRPAKSHATFADSVEDFPLPHSASALDFMANQGNALDYLSNISGRQNSPSSSSLSRSSAVADFPGYPHGSPPIVQVGSADYASPTMGHSALPLGSISSRQLSAAMTATPATVPTANKTNSYLSSIDLPAYQKPTANSSGSTNSIFPDGGALSFSSPQKKPPQQISSKSMFGAPSLSTKAAAPPTAIITTTTTTTTTAIDGPFPSRKKLTDAEVAKHLASMHGWMIVCSSGASVAFVFAVVLTSLFWSSMWKVAFMGTPVAFVVILVFAMCPWSLSRTLAFTTTYLWWIFTAGCAAGVVMGIVYNVQYCGSSVFLGYYEDQEVGDTFQHDPIAFLSCPYPNDVIHQNPTLALYRGTLLINVFLFLLGTVGSICSASYSYTLEEAIPEYQDFNYERDSDL